MYTFENMDLETRIGKYVANGFGKQEAQIVVLMEEAAGALFAKYPHRFVLCGGASLVFFYGSPRLSRDLDLFLEPEDALTLKEIRDVIAERVGGAANVLGYGELQYREEKASLAVRSGDSQLFTIDVPRFGGRVIKNQTVENKLQGSNDTVTTPSKNYFLLQKVETFLERQKIKARDAFDVHILLATGATLDKPLREHLSDYLASRELEEADVLSRIEQLDRKTCSSELRHIIPPVLFNNLVETDFVILRDNLKKVFEPVFGGN